MRVEHTTNTIKPSHTGLVFANKQDADKKDLSNVVGRFDEKRREIALLDGTQAGDKYRALINAGLQMYLQKDDRNNYYITNLLDNINSMTKTDKSFSDYYSEAIEGSELSTVDRDERPDILFKEFDAFMAEDNESAMDLDFTLPSLKYEHRVGLYNEDSNVYTLREDVLDFLDDFSFHIDENEEGVVARINPESLKGRTLLKLTNLLKKQEQDEDENDLQDDDQKDQKDSGLKESIHDILEREGIKLRGFQYA
ncbi:hypothetical protein CGJ43_00060 [Vibrio parahaemolyticus]|uniref:hypothetical protein n=1 Tax=Vibrio parahaemolyticus TaxID=670 RepID=UPI0011240DED|nr:hypothetical protein [Vibrio parahaemolyticus]MBE4278851.1 hypothetical protein [Vibrio parahaemolyticus]TOE43878.1 hypothetical protein CGJ43_00060 [Vibrio parahaemolyticus]